MTPARTGIAAAVAVLTIAAAVVLRWESAHHEITGAASSCVISEKVDCDRVQASSYAKVLGVSLSTLGAAALLVLLVWLLAGRRSPTLLVAAGALALFNLAFALYTAYVSWFVLGAVCLYCTAMQAGIVVLAALVVPPAWRSLGRGLEPRPACFGGIAGVLVLLLAVSGDAYASQRAGLLRLFHQPAGDALRLDVSDALVIGDPETPLPVLVFFDFGCPICKKCFAAAVKLQAEYPDEVHFVFKHFPLEKECNEALDRTANHNACRAAFAGQAASELGGTLPAMHYLFSKQGDGFTRRVIAELGEKLGETEKQWTSRLASESVKSLVERDIAEGNGLELYGVPTVYINGRYTEANYMVPRIKKLLEPR